jgi:hypothetical protein
MNPSYFTEEHQLFRESLKDFLQKEVVPHIENGKKRTIERFIWKKFEKWAFFINYPEVWWVELRFVLHRIFLEELQRLNHLVLQLLCGHILI